MSDFIQNLPQKKLPIWATIREAFGFAWGYRRILWGWIVVGAIVTGLGGLVGEFSYGEEGWGLTGFPYFAAILLTPIPGLLVFALLAVYCHRTFLIYHGDKTLNLRFFFTERERKFFAWIMGISLCIFLIILPGIFVGVIIWDSIIEMFPEGFWEDTIIGDLFVYGVFLFPFYYIFGRWVLVFPAIAIDQEPRMGWSWKQTKGNGWRMFVLVGILPLTVGNLWFLLSFIGLSEFPVFNSFLASFSLFLFTPVEVAVISIAFRELTNGTPSTPQPEEAPVA